MKLPFPSLFVGALLVLSLTAAPFRAWAARPLDIYWIDVEGGAATLIVTPAGESLLVDAGNPGERDPGRIAHVARDIAGLKQIDHCIITHWHADHVGGVPMVAKRIPIQHFYDRGIPSPLPKDINAGQMAAYRECSQGKSVTLKPGDEISLKVADGQPPVTLKVMAGSGLRDEGMRVKEMLVGGNRVTLPPLSVSRCRIAK